MKVLRGDLRTWQPGPEGVALTIGVFDGVHLGHRHLLDELRRRSDGVPVAVLTFDRHPLAVVAPEAAPRLITTLEQRLELLAGAGVDLVAVLTFDEEVRSLEPMVFIDRIVVGAIGARLIVVGEDFRFGRGRGGDVTMLRQAGRRLGFDVAGMELVGETAPFSSTAIRRALGDGDVAGAAVALGRPFELRGTVVTGDRRGRTIGFPTANLDLPPGIVVPGHGVYAARAGIGTARHPAVVNVGTRPTFGGEREVVEVHLLDTEVNLYGAELRVDFVARVRDEQRFDGVDALVAQIGRDVAAAGKVLAG